MSQRRGSRKLAVVGPHDSRSGDELLLAAAGGDGASFAVFYRRHLAGVLAFFFRRVRSHELAADLAAETFAGVLLSCGRYRPGPEPAVAWLYGIARNKLRESARRGRVEQQARETLEMPALVFDDEDLARVDELLSAGNRALALLDALPAAQRNAVRGRVVDERDYGDLACELGCSEQLVRQHVSRGLRHLKTMVEDHE